MRAAQIGVVLVAIVGGLWLLDQVLAAQQQHNQAVMEATTTAINTLVVDMHATDVAFGATQQVPIDAAATRAVGTLAAYRATMDTSVHATATAIARR